MRLRASRLCRLGLACLLAVHSLLAMRTASAQEPAEESLSDILKKLDGPEGEKE